MNFTPNPAQFLEKNISQTPAIELLSKLGYTYIPPPSA
jgi:hypothetical protein